jgi:ATP-dependent DNA ligase
MLCSGYEDKLIEKMKWPAMVQLKMDGMRFNAIVRDNAVEFRTRNGKEIHLHGNLEQEFIQIANGIDCVFDGELVVSYFDGIMDRQTGNGILNKAIKGTISDTEAALVRAIVWDVIPYMYFVDSYCPTPYKDRFAKFKWGIDFPNKIQLVQSTIVENIEEARAKFEEYYNAGQEGIILKDMSSPWEDKRAKHQIKFKGELECDLKVVGYEEGTGKYVGKLGALVCESDDGIIKVKVGSGFNDEDREKIKEQDVLGKVVAVKYNARIRSKHQDESLFLPIFLEIREDKNQADPSGSIK